jgi:hypothetical protein
MKKVRYTWNNKTEVGFVPNPTSPFLLEKKRKLYSKGSYYHILTQDYGYRWIHEKNLQFIEGLPEIKERVEEPKVTEEVMESIEEVHIFDVFYQEDS